jgi:CubicO group peptidase (beta-lactamase class C family)
MVIRPHRFATRLSGLPRLPNNLGSVVPEYSYADCAAKDLEGLIPKARLRRDPGDAVEDSKVGGELLGHVPAPSVGLSYEELVTSRVWGPLGMKDTRITLSEEEKNRFVPVHNPGG